MRTIVAGTRKYAKQRFDESLDEFIERTERNKDTLYRILNIIHHQNPITAVLSGEAKGPDIWGRQWAEDHGVVVEKYPADWSKGKGAGFARNEEMVKKADRLIAFHDRISRGTNHVIKYAMDNGIYILEFRILEK